MIRRLSDRFATLARLPGRFSATLTLGLLLCSATLPANADDALPQVRMVTSEGVIEIQLRPDLAPETVANFLSYVDDGFYDGTLFHRVISGFMIQGGGFDSRFQQKETRDPVVNESRQTARNLRGTLAMARTAHPDSATAQFFINLVDNRHLDAAPGRPGYTVFGKVTSGMGVVDAIAGARTGVRNNMGDVPLEPIVIESARRIQEPE